MLLPDERPQTPNGHAEIARRFADVEQSGCYLEDRNRCTATYFSGHRNTPTYKKEIPAAAVALCTGFGRPSAECASRDDTEETLSHTRVYPYRPFATSGCDSNHETIKPRLTLSSTKLVRYFRTIGFYPTNLVSFRVRENNDMATREKGSGC